MSNLCAEGIIVTNDKGEKSETLYLGVCLWYISREVVTAGQDTESGSAKEF